MAAGEEERDNGASFVPPAPPPPPPKTACPTCGARGRKRCWLCAQAVCCNASALTGRPCALYGQPEAQEASFDPATFDAAFPSLGGGRPPPKLLAHCLPACFTDGLLARDRRDR